MTLHRLLLHMPATRLCFLLLISLVAQAMANSPNPTPQGNSWAPCGFAVQQLSHEGNGSTYGSCLSCSPSSATCPPKCQPLIDALYEQCDGVFAPQDLYFDPAMTLNGYFNDHMDKLRVDAARCGCSLAPMALRMASAAAAISILCSLSLVLHGSSPRHSY